MSEMISATVLLFLIMDSLGNLPIFMSVLKHLEPKRRRVIVIREMLIALLLMLIFLFAGEHILSFLNLRTETVSISGGIILFLIAIKMIFPSQEGNSTGLPAGEEPFLVPLTIPLGRRPVNPGGDDAAIASISNTNQSFGPSFTHRLGSVGRHPDAVQRLFAVAGE